MTDMFGAIGFEIPDEAAYNALAETADAMGDETSIDRRGATLHGRCWRLGEGIEIWTVLRAGRGGVQYVDCRPAFRPRYAHQLGPWELTEYDEDGEAVVEGRIGRGESEVSFELQNLTELEFDTFLQPMLTVGVAGLAYDVKAAEAGTVPGLRASDREGAARPPDGNDYLVTGRVEKWLPLLNPHTGVELMWIYVNAGNARFEIVARRETIGADVMLGGTIEAEVWLQGYVLSDETVRARFEGIDPEWKPDESWRRFRRTN